MALDRTWYNTLVDDSGDGISGSVWDKADVDSLMDAVDLEFSRTPTWQSWDPQWFTSTSEVTVPTQNSCRFYRIGNVVHVNLFATEMFFGTAAPALQFFLPPGSELANPTIERYTVAIRLGQGTIAYELGIGTAKDTFVGEIRRANGQDFSGFMHVSIHGQGFYLLA